MKITSPPACSNAWSSNGLPSNRGPSGKTVGGPAGAGREVVAPPVGPERGLMALDQAVVRQTPLVIRPPRRRMSRSKFVLQGDVQPGLELAQACRQPQELVVERRAGDGRHEPVGPRRTGAGPAQFGGLPSRSWSGAWLVCGAP